LAKKGQARSLDIKDHYWVDIDTSNDLKKVSPVAWQHINLHGRYEFSKRPEAIDLQAIIQQLSQLASLQN
jgi:hypothetical protein